MNRIMFSQIYKRMIIDQRLRAAGTICSTLFLIGQLVIFAPLSYGAKTTDSMQKRKDAIFKLADKLGVLRHPTKSDVEKVIGCTVWAKSAGWYSSDRDETKDIEYFEVPYDGDLKVTCTVLLINPKLDITLKDVVRKYGKWKSTYRTPGLKEDKLEPALVYCYKLKKMSINFEFRKKNQKQLDSITAVPNTTPEFKKRL